ncbi:hypothetical protein BASA60_010098 [Batrachochytrium salamandrivorans]|nr:hypothetical protein BASA60_010098 [Batrachochytrium salamandrivorans]
MSGPKAQAEAMRKRNGFRREHSGLLLQSWRYGEDETPRSTKLEFNWKGPYHVVDVGHPGTYWIMTPQGLRLPNAVNQADLAPWLAPVLIMSTFSTMGLIETHLWIRKGLGLIMIFFWGGDSSKGGVVLQLSACPP